MKVMWNKMLVMSLILTLGVGFSGCGSSNKKKSADPYKDQIAGSTSDWDLNGESDKGSAGPLRTVYFAYDSSSLSSRAKEVLDDNADFLNKNRNVSVQIEGHCDERGGIQYNLALGERRAKTIRDYLMGSGVAARQLDIVSYGKERPLEFGHSESTWSKNRRGNFVITSK